MFAAGFSPLSSISHVAVENIRTVFAGISVQASLLERIIIGRLLHHSPISNQHTSPPKFPESFSFLCHNPCIANCTWATRRGGSARLLFQPQPRASISPDFTLLQSGGCLVDLIWISNWPSTAGDSGRLGNSRPPTLSLLTDHLVINILNRPTGTPYAPIFHRLRPNRAGVNNGSEHPTLTTDACTK